MTEAEQALARVQADATVLIENYAAGDDRNRLGNDLRLLLSLVRQASGSSLRDTHRAADPLVVALCQSLADNDDPEEPIADNGASAIDGWRDLARRILARPHRDPVPPVVGLSAVANFEPDDTPKGFIEWTFVLPRSVEVGAGLYEIRFLRCLTHEERASEASSFAALAKATPPAETVSPGMSEANEPNTIAGDRT